MTLYHEELTKQEDRAAKELRNKYNDYIAILFAISTGGNRSDYVKRIFDERLSEIRAFNRDFSKRQVRQAYVRSYDIGFSNLAKERRELSQKDIDTIDIMTTSTLLSLNGMAEGYMGKANTTLNNKKLDKLVGVDRRYEKKSSMALRNNKGAIINPKSLANAYTSVAVWQSGTLGYASSLKKVGVEEVQYHTQFDERVCPSCSPKDGVIYRLPEDTPMLPPTHNICRCWIEPII